MPYLRFVTCAFLLITRSGKLWQGQIISDTAKHRHILTTYDTTYIFAEDEVQEIVRAGSPKTTVKKHNDNYDEFNTAPPEQPVYRIPYTPDRLNYPDYVISKKGDLYEGWVIVDHVKDYVIMRLKDSTLMTIPYSNIRRVNYSNNTWASISSRKVKERKPVDLTHLHNVGLGLTIAGSVLIAGGIPLIATAPYSTTRTNTSVTATSTSGGAVVGVLLELIGVPLLIPGIVTLARFSHLIKKQRNAVPKDL